VSIDRLVAQEELRIFGGVPKVNRHQNESNDDTVDILKCVDVPQKGIQSCASIGLNGTDIGLLSGDSKLRVEILGASDISVNEFENIVASVAFYIMKSQKCFPGYIVPNVIEQYIENCEMKHVLLSSPFLWENVKSISFEDICIAWLLIVPISDAEYGYAQEHGVDSLETLFEEKEIDIFNMFRKSLV
jgi:Suppressor of fused protein (SUFU).